MILTQCEFVLAARVVVIPVVAAHHFRRNFLKVPVIEYGRQWRSLVSFPCWGIFRENLKKRQHNNKVTPQPKKLLSSSRIPQTSAYRFHKKLPNMVIEHGQTRLLSNSPTVTVSRSVILVTIVKKVRSPLHPDHLHQGG